MKISSNSRKLRIQANEIRLDDDSDTLNTQYYTRNNAFKGSSSNQLPIYEYRLLSIGNPYMLSIDKYRLIFHQILKNRAENEYNLKIASENIDEYVAYSYKLWIKAVMKSFSQEGIPKDQANFHEQIVKEMIGDATSSIQNYNLHKTLILKIVKQISKKTERKVNKSHPIASQFTSPQFGYYASDNFSKLKFLSKAERLKLLQQMCDRHREWNQMQRISDDRTEKDRPKTFKIITKRIGTPDSILTNVEDLILFRGDFDIKDVHSPQNPRYQQQILQFQSQLVWELINYHNLTKEYYPSLQPQYILFDQMSLQYKLSYEPILLKALALDLTPQTIEHRLACNATPSPYDAFSSPLQLRNELQRSRSVAFQNEQNLKGFPDETTPPIESYNQREQQILVWRVLMICYYFFHRNQFIRDDNGVFRSIEDASEFAFKEKESIWKGKRKIEQFLKNAQKKQIDQKQKEEKAFGNDKFEFTLDYLENITKGKEENSIFKEQKIDKLRLLHKARKQMQKWLLQLVLKEKSFQRCLNAKKYILLFYMECIIEAWDAEALARYPKQMKLDKQDQNLDRVYQKIVQYQNRLQNDDQKKFLLKLENDALQTIKFIYKQIKQIKQLSKAVEFENNAAKIIRISHEILKQCQKQLLYNLFEFLEKYESQPERLHQKSYSNTVKRDEDIELTQKVIFTFKTVATLKEDNFAQYQVQVLTHLNHLMNLMKKKVDEPTSPLSSAASKMSHRVSSVHSETSPDHYFSQQRPINSIHLKALKQFFSPKKTSKFNQDLQKQKEISQKVRNLYKNEIKQDADTPYRSQMIKESNMYIADEKNSKYFRDNLKFEDKLRKF